MKESRCKATSQSCRLLLVENGGSPRTDPFKALGMLRRAPLPCRKLSSFRISAHASPAGAARGESAAEWASSNPRPPSSPPATQQVLGRARLVLPACARWPVARRRWWPARRSCGALGWQTSRCALVLLLRCQVEAEEGAGRRFLEDVPRLRLADVSPRAQGALHRPR